MENEIEQADMEIERNGERMLVTIEGYVHYSVDTSWGEDADGNRGSRRVDVTGATHICAYDPDSGEEYVLTDTEMNVAEEIIGNKFLGI